MVRPCDDCKGSGIGTCPADTDGDGNCAVCSWLASTHACTTCNCVVCAHQPGTHACITCIDMPRLPALCFTPYMEQTYLFDKYAPEDAPEWWKQDERGKPDPSTVMHWCQVHQSAALTAGVNCYRQLHESEYGESLDGDCDIVWIELPTALKEDKNGKYEKLQKE